MILVQCVGGKIVVIHSVADRMRIHARMMDPVQFGFVWTDHRNGVRLDG